MGRLSGQLILDLFPGGGLFAAAFIKAGATVVSGPDILLGQPISEFNVIGAINKFDGIIGSPPCQLFSKANLNKENLLQKRENLIPDFLFIVNVVKPRWAVMENVTTVKFPLNGEWKSVDLSDWDCGGFTQRKRRFWFYKVPPPAVPARREGRGSYSVLATSFEIRKYKDNRPAAYLSNVSAEEAMRLQGFPGRDKIIQGALPGKMSKKARQQFIVHLAGNGVPLALGAYVAGHISQVIKHA